MGAMAMGHHARSSWLAFRAFSGRVRFLSDSEGLLFGGGEGSERDGPDLTDEPAPLRRTSAACGPPGELGDLLESVLEAMDVPSITLRQPARLRQLGFEPANPTA